MTLGEVLDGDRMAKSMYNVKFMQSLDTAQLCTITLDQKQIEHLKSAIEDLYYFEFVAGNVELKLNFWFNLYFIF